MAKAKEEKVFINPFDNSVTYVQFLEAKGTTSVAEYCKGKLTAEQIEWLENDLKHFIKK